MLDVQVNENLWRSQRITKPKNTMRNITPAPRAKLKVLKISFNIAVSRGVGRARNVRLGLFSHGSGPAEIHPERSSRLRPNLDTQSAIDAPPKRPFVLRQRRLGMGSDVGTFLKCEVEPRHAAGVLPQSLLEPAVHRETPRIDHSDRPITACYIGSDPPSNLPVLMAAARSSRQRIASSAPPAGSTTTLEVLTGSPVSATTSASATR